MALIRADAHPILVTFPVEEDDNAKVIAKSLSLRFQLQEESMYVEEEMVYPESGNVTHAIGQLFFRNNKGKL